MMQYANKARAQAKCFGHVEFKQIPREENTEADDLAKLGACTTNDTLE